MTFYYLNNKNKKIILLKSFNSNISQFNQIKIH